MAIGQSFDETAAYYDSWMRKAIPGYDDLFTAATQIIPFPAETPLHVLDLGAGTGLFSQRVFSSYPNAKFVLVDLAEKLMDIAHHRFKNYPDQFSYLIQDYRELDGKYQYNLVISSLSIHHLTDHEKAELFGRIYQLLRSPGIFVNVDQVRGETLDLQRLYWDQWLAHVRNMGGTEEEILSSTQRRQTYDKDALLSDQLNWLRAAGFSNVDCVYKHYFVGVFIGMKP
jgi:tRNA (cmo5U34)-methyltransferase